MHPNACAEKSTNYRYNISHTLNPTYLVSPVAASPVAALAVAASPVAVCGGLACLTARHAARVPVPVHASAALAALPVTLGVQHVGRQLVLNAGQAAVGGCTGGAELHGGAAG